MIRYTPYASRTHHAQRDQHLGRHDETDDAQDRQDDPGRAVEGVPTLAQTRQKFVDRPEHRLFVDHLGHRDRGDGDRRPGAAVEAAAAVAPCGSAAGRAAPPTTAEGNGPSLLARPTGRGSRPAISVTDLNRAAGSFSSARATTLR